MVSEDLRRTASADGRPRDVPVRELTAQLGEQLTRLVREETALAKAEMFASARQAMLGGGMFGGAGLAGVTAWLAMVAAAIAGIAEGLPVWASALIMGGALGMLANVLALLGCKRLKRGTPPLRMTADSVRKELGELAAGGRRK